VRCDKRVVREGSWRSGPGVTSARAGCVVFWLRICGVAVAGLVDGGGGVGRIRLLSGHGRREADTQEQASNGGTCSILKDDTLGLMEG
jgi:hypothetical protein